MNPGTMTAIVDFGIAIFGLVISLLVKLTEKVTFSDENFKKEINKKFAIPTKNLKQHLSHMIDESRRTENVEELIITYHENLDSYIKKRYKWERSYNSKRTYGVIIWWVTVINLISIFTLGVLWVISSVNSDYVWFEKATWIFLALIAILFLISVFVTFKEIALKRELEDNE